MNEIWCALHLHVSMHGLGRYHPIFGPKHAAIILVHEVYTHRTMPFNIAHVMSASFMVHGSYCNIGIYLPMCLKLLITVPPAPYISLRFVIQVQTLYEQSTMISTIYFETVKRSKGELIRSTYAEFRTFSLSFSLILLNNQIIAVDSFQRIIDSTVFFSLYPPFLRGLCAGPMTGNNPVN